MASGSYITYEERERIRELVGLGYTRDQIAEAIQRSRGTVDRYIVRLGLLKPRTLRSPIEKPEKTFEAPPKIKTDHLAHCQAIMGADEPGKPYGCGFPVCDTRAAYRVAA
jgi:hypothetical protein